MKYSIVIPTYNNKVLLKNTLEAINYLPGYGYYEVIVADDGSTDNTYKYIQKVARNYNLKYFYLERSPDSSRARTRNQGWRNAEGDIVIFIDSDIIVRPDYLFELDRCFSLSMKIAVIGNRLLLNEPSEFRDIINCDIFKKYRFAAGNMDILEYRYFIYQSISYNAASFDRPWTQVYTCNLAVPRKWLEIIGGFDENFKGWGVEDIEFGYSLYKQGVQIVINPKLEVLHQYHGIRNDLVIKKENIPGYERNIRYFLRKHPDAIDMPEEKAFKYLKGEIADDSIKKIEKPRYIGIDFKDRKELDKLKTLILFNMKSKKTILVINDYVENTDLDIWVQLQKGDCQTAVRYYPMSKRFDAKIADAYLKNERERQVEASEAEQMKE